MQLQSVEHPSRDKQDHKWSVEGRELPNPVPKAGRFLEIVTGPEQLRRHLLTLFTRSLTGEIVIPLAYWTSSFFAVSAGAVSQRW